MYYNFTSFSFFVGKTNSRDQLYKYYILLLIWFYFYFLLFTFDCILHFYSLLITCKNFSIDLFPYKIDHHEMNE